MALAQLNLSVLYFLGLGVERDDLQGLLWTRKAAEQGLAEAQYALGRIYAAGTGVPKDESAAAQWFARASQQGYTPPLQDSSISIAKGEGPASGP